MSKDVVVVTGGSNGLGRAIAQRFAEKGASVAVFDRNQEEGEAFAARLVEQGLDVMFVACDVTRRDMVKSAVNAVVARHGTINVLVNNAGIGMRVPFLEISEETWRDVLDVNLNGSFHVAQEVCRVMAASGGGAVINMASIAARLSHSNQAGYAVTKAGLEALTRAMAFELGPLNIRTNAVAPGTIATDLVSRMMTEDARIEREKRIPLGRMGTPEEVADLFVFLASDEARYINGAVMQIDGGLQIAGIRSAS